MKRNFSILLIVVLALSLALVGCAGEEAPEETEKSE
jgi:PBP1b-binding outer membrane lipoprotein LpoB